MENSNNQSNRAGIFYLLSLAGNNKISMLAAIIFSTLSGFCTFVPFLMVFQTMMFIFSLEGDMHTVFGYGIIAITAIVLRFGFQAISMALTHIGAYNTLYEVRKKVCSHMGKINLGFFTSNSTGEIKKVLMEDVERLEKFLAHQVPDIVVAIVVPITVLAYLFTVNVWMTLMLLLPIVVAFLTQIVLIPISKKPMDNFYTIAGKQSAVILQFINGMPVMKSYNLTATSYQEYAQTVNQYERAWWDIAKWVSPISAVLSVVLESGLLFTLPLGGWLYLSGNLSLSSYFFFVIMSIVFLTSFSNLMNFAQIFSQISSGIGRIKNILDTPAINDGSTVLSPDTCRDITFENVSFSYGENEVLHDVSISLFKGSITAFVGASGAGKSTAAQLIPRFWDVTKGKILLDDIDIRNLPASNLMDIVSFVFQEAFMLEDTIFANISVGKADCTKYDVENAAKAAQIHDFIQSLPKGYDTPIGSEGVKLSGGERQRICIARAILKNAPVIIFDEATSFTDIENEYKIQKALGNLLKGKTTIMIAHRLHTIVKADQICVFDKGNLVECGSHHKLLDQHGTYEKMWNKYTQTDEEVSHD